MTVTPTINKENDGKPTRRDFLSLTGVAMGAMGAAIFAVPLIDTMNPAADTLAIVNTGKLARAKTRIKDLETKWDRAEAVVQVGDRPGLEWGFLGRADRRHGEVSLLTGT